MGFLRAGFTGHNYCSAHKINAVEMEGAGAAAAIEQAGSQGISTRFMMIRGISDLPRAKGKNKGRKERDDWKPYASDVPLPL